MTVLVVGAGGLLGSNVVQCVLGQGNDVVGTYHSSAPDFEIPLEQLDIVDEASFRRLLDAYEPDAVINCAAMTDVDRCESDPDAAGEINGYAPGRLADECRSRGIEFVHVSTDYVFDGESERPYDEDATPSPIQVYGRSKRLGEHEVFEADEEALVVRLSFVWGIHRATGDLTGFPAWVRDRLVAGEATPLFTDQHVSPSRAGATAETLLDLLDGGHSGLFHVAARSCVSPHEFGIMLCERLGADETLIEQGQQSNVDRPAERPSHTCLDVGRVESALGREQPTLSEDLDSVSSLL
jgi:dTDP-4-dehydrorhamnose reductase